MTTDQPFELITVQDLEHFRPDADLSKHPRVLVDMQRLTLTIRGLRRYEIDLQGWSSPAQVLDSLLQISRKPWCDRILAGELLAAVETVCRLKFHQSAQRVLCPWGRSQAVEWGANAPEPCVEGQDSGPIPKPGLKPPGDNIDGLATSKN